MKPALFIALAVSFFSTIAVSSAPAHAQNMSALTIPDAECKEFPTSIFKPCICSEAVPVDIKYRPVVKECNKRAGAVLFGEYAGTFSVVPRDKQNRDRFPVRGYHRCTTRETNLGLNKCSAFKCQKVLKLENSSVGAGNQQICCFGEAGTSTILRGATRLTIKVKDIPESSSDPLLRVCLAGFNPRRPLN